MKVTNIKASAKLDDYSTLVLVTSYYCLVWVESKCLSLSLTHKKQSNFVTVKCNDKVWATFFRVGASGRLHINITGCTNVKEVKDAAAWVVEFLFPKGGEIKLDFRPIVTLKIDNITAVAGHYEKNSVDIVKLKKLVTEFYPQFLCRQNPEIFSGLCVKYYTIEGAAATAIIYRSGRIILFGAKKTRDCKHLVERLELLIQWTKRVGNSSSWPTGS